MVYSNLGQLLSNLNVGARNIRACILTSKAWFFKAAPKNTAADPIWPLTTEDLNRFVRWRISTGKVLVDAYIL